MFIGSVFIIIYEDDLVELEIETSVMNFAWFFNMSFSPEMRLFLSLLVRMICFKEASPPIKRQNSPNAKSYDSASPHSSGDVKLNRSSGKLTRQLMLTQRRQEVLLEVSLILF